MVFSGTPLLSAWSHECWQFDLFETSLYMWKFLAHVLLKPSLKDFEHNLASMRNESNTLVVWTFFGIDLLWDWNENWNFPVCDHYWVFQICWHTECSTLTASSFRIWTSSAGIPWPPVALFIVMLPQALLTSYSRVSGSRWATTQSWLSGSLRPFLYSSSVCSCHLFLISSASVTFVPFLSFLCLFQILKDDAVKVLHSICQQIWKTQQWSFTGLEKVSFHSNPKQGQCQNMLSLPYH